MSEKMVLAALCSGLRAGAGIRALLEAAAGAKCEMM